jgi:hypothetical protein
LWRQFDSPSSFLPSPQSGSYIKSRGSWTTSRGVPTRYTVDASALFASSPKNLLPTLFQDSAPELHSSQTEVLSIYIPKHLHLYNCTIFSTCFPIHSIVSQHTTPCLRITCSLMDISPQITCIRGWTHLHMALNMRFNNFSSMWIFTKTPRCTETAIQNIDSIHMVLLVVEALLVPRAPFGDA